MSSSGKDLAYVLALMIAGLASYFWGVGQYRLKKAIEYTPTSKAVSVAPGAAEVAGAAMPAGSLLSSPLLHKQCVYYETQVFKWSGSGKHRKKVLVQEFESDSPFYMEDDTGKVLVAPKLLQAGDGIAAFSWAGLKNSKARELVDIDKRMSGVPKKPITSIFNFTKKEGARELVQFLEDHVPSLAGYMDEVEVAERAIEPGDQVYMIGAAKEIERNGKAEMLVGREGGKPFCVADGTEKKVLSSIALWAYVSLLFGPMLFALCFIYLCLRFGISSQFAVFASGTAVALMYLYVAAKVALEFANSMVILRNNVDRARANLHVLLKRRSDLIANLNSVVVAAAKHERGLQGKIASLRPSGLGKGGLFALAEAYPKLRANENFALLQHELSHTENWIAGSRSYVADSIMLYNTRISSFPYIFLAPVMKLSRIEYLQE